MALVLIFIFAYLIPVFPLGGSSLYVEKIDLSTIASLLKAMALPALSIVIVSALGWWFLSSRTLTLRVMTEDYVEHAIMRGLPWSLIVRRYVLRNILLPQVTALGLALGGIFSGAIITEAIFAYPGLGLLLFSYIYWGLFHSFRNSHTLDLWSLPRNSSPQPLIPPARP
jgi:peptide/nickel transport system permease protein